MGARDLRTILVVDDDVALRLLCRVNLELEGHRVLEAATSEHARELLGSEAVDVVLLDLHLGLENGLDLVEEIRRADAAVALLTGTPEIPPETRARVDAVLPKPFAIDGLLDAVRGLVRLPLS
jgi:two-component system, OmpR family, response regulator